MLFRSILSIGYPGNTVSEVIKKLSSENFSIAHYDMRFVAPLDKETLHDIFRKYSRIITVEDGILSGGFGSAIVEFMSDNGYNAKIKRLGIPDYFVEHGLQEELYKECGFDADNIELAIRKMMCES